MRNNPTSKKITFLQLLTNESNVCECCGNLEWQPLDKVEIPIIQRDYAQGREGKEELRDNFLDALYKAVNGEELELDFVYGSVEKDKEGTITFQPLDGQQRLTTLFLLYWYIAIKEDRLNGELKELLTKFTYETRTSSREFCRDLINEGIDLKKMLETDFHDKEKEKPKNNGLSKTIINSPWFFLSWKRDPTIKSMLTMLDHIHKKFKGGKNVWDKLNNISFHYIELQNFGLSDDLYIKMNARGKALTDFENFKANFSVLFNQANKSKLDNEWLDVFWKFEKDNDIINLKGVDRKYLTFIENISLCFWAESEDISKTEKDDFSIFKNYDKIYSSNYNYLNQIVKIFDALTTYQDTKKYFESFLKPNPDYWEYLRFYSVAQFFIHCGEIKIANVKTYNKWIRVCHNLINNTLIQAPDEFYKAIRSIKEIATHINDIYEYLTPPKTKVAFFLQNQSEEEKIKAKLILADKSNKWREAIEKIERHSYFNGQVGFILNFAKNNNGYDIKRFSDYSEKIGKLFSSEFKDNYDCLFQRALLTFGDYLVPISGRFTFCNFNEGLRDKIDNWRKAFNDDIKSNYLKQLLDKISINLMQEDLQTIISDFQVNENDWKSLFIKNKGIIEYCNNYKINKFNDGKHIDLARSSASRWRKKAELRSYVLYKTKLEGKESAFNPFQRVWYYDSSDKIPCAVIDHWKYQSKYRFTLDIGYSNSQFTLRFFDRNRLDLPSEVIEILEKLEFSKDIEKVEDLVTNTTVGITKSYTKDNIDFTEIEDEIRGLINHCLSLYPINTN